MHPLKDRHHPLRARKTRICRDWKKSEKSCQYGEACAFAHGYLELHNVLKEHKGDERHIKKWYEGRSYADTPTEETQKAISKGTELTKIVNSSTCHQDHFPTPMSAQFNTHLRPFNPSSRRTVFDPSTAPFTPTKDIPCVNASIYYTPQHASASLHSQNNSDAELMPLPHMYYNDSRAQEESLLSQLFEKTSLACRLNMKVIALTDYQSGSKKRIQLLEKRINDLESKLKDSNTEAGYLRGHNALLEKRIYALESDNDRHLGLTNKYQESIKYVGKLEKQRKQLAKVIAKLLTIKIDNIKDEYDAQVSKNLERKEEV
ncbi:hypothetical protein NEOLI_003981 [Neolecta irregularis DAH-3]|uniref:C3H1-type domain-containing protein n=1 Tax=Neolecta irregularis (strain DAH-3) TaxID=1198029 RepID=A0A1U7LPH8_NEOID|nr:hypothetical protein NEOLI_003981 [Neolecta irregularis DAH-3]|eukprot:OLL24493.1 hypothetical protein NEOLI_003981 [Neolecta irregularis DAH-3]